MVAPPATTTQITNLGDQINDSGAVGLVQQDATTRNITVAKDTDGKQVSFAGTEGDRVLTNVARNGRRDLGRGDRTVRSCSAPASRW